MDTLPEILFSEARDLAQSRRILRMAVQAPLLP